MWSSIRMTNLNRGEAMVYWAMDPGVPSPISSSSKNFILRNTLSGVGSHY